ncbi:hypothetical protein [Occallatibacter riparius]|uniref:Uncharacterized protein n=1 Tax=Occallatibacter riparius TaxID=1002689 RepID=A0A9J7BRE7_9BACT|nr:hypothetical protein [Occallatibacter riparius]UWZ85151.1 hypothetical protein MOP44_04210 [Occallatibacter riparius]
MKFTRAALKKYSESAPQFAVRRLELVTKRLKASGEVVSFTKLRDLAGVGWGKRTGKHPMVVRALAVARAELGI